MKQDDYGNLVAFDLVALISDVAYQLDYVNNSVGATRGIVRDEMHPIVYDVAMAIARAHETDESKRHVDAIYAPYGFLIRLNDSVDSVEHLLAVLDDTVTHIEASG